MQGVLLEIFLRERARPIGRSGFGGIRSLFVEENVVATVVELDTVHETSHEEHPSAVGCQSVFRVGRVGEGAYVEALAFVGDFDIHAIFGKAAFDVDRFGKVHFVAMLDRVDQRLFQGKVDAEDVVLAPAGLLEVFEDLIAQNATRSRLARDRPVTAPKPLMVRHDKDKGDCPSCLGVIA